MLQNQMVASVDKVASEVQIGAASTAMGIVAGLSNSPMTEAGPPSISLLERAMTTTKPMNAIEVESVQVEPVSG